MLKSLLPKRSKGNIPEHNVLSKVVLWESMMDIVHLGFKYFPTQELDDNVIPGMVKSSQDAANGQHEDDRGKMYLHLQNMTTQVHGK